MKPYVKKTKEYLEKIIFRKSLTKKEVIIGRFSIVDANCAFEGMNIIRTESSLSNVSLGYASYIGNRCVFVKTKIGKYCSIGDEVRIVRGQHPHKTFISTHPAFYSPQNKLGYVERSYFNEFKFVDQTNEWALLIGNDVWIGTGVKIMEGIEVGDGAVIASGAVVTKDVEPFSIVGGVPAKHLSYRFDKNIIELLLKFKWWDKSNSWVKNNAKLFSDPKIFVEMILTDFKENNH